MQIFYDENNYDIYLQHHVSFFPGINYAASLLLHAVRNHNIYHIVLCNLSSRWYMHKYFSFLMYLSHRYDYYLLLLVLAIHCSCCM